MGTHAEDELMLVRVIALLEEPAMNSPVVVLHDAEDNRILPIWIGEPEARAIAMAFQDVETSRPLTHTLLSNVIHEMGGHVMSVAIESLDAATYFATISIDVGKKKPLMIDARPSDSIALALELDTPIYVAKSVLDAAGQDNPFPNDPAFAGPSMEVMTEIFIQNVTPPKKKKTKGKAKGKGKKQTPKAKSHPPSKAKTKFDEKEIDKLKALLEQAREFEEGKG
jgi:hypothetical protein